MKATKTFTDKFGKLRRNGEEWLVKLSDAETYIPDVYEEVSLHRIFFLNGFGKLTRLFFLGSGS